LLFELADRAGSEGFVGSFLADSDNFVNLEHTQLAAAWCAYLESHARRVYACVVTPQLRAALELADKIKKRKLAALFSCRDVYLKGWNGLSTPDVVKQATEGTSGCRMGPGCVPRIGSVRRTSVQPVPSKSKGIGMSTPVPRSPWMKWKPKAHILANSAGREPTKPSEKLGRTMEHATGLTFN
jgi:hypothetical protein